MEKEIEVNTNNININPITENNNNNSDNPKTVIPSIGEKLIKAESLKLAGNGFIGKKQYKDALREYHKANMYVKGLDNSAFSSLFKDKIPEDKMPAMPSADQVVKIKIMSVQIHANMALCHLRLEQPERVLDDAKKALELANTSDDPECKKLLPKIKLRRGAAYVLLNDLERAEADLNDAAKELKKEDIEPEMKLLRKKTTRE